jgi:hypothetical protein
MPRLQCDVCGAKSILVDNPKSVTARELQALMEFRVEHDANCGNDIAAFPAGAVSQEVPVQHVGPFGSPKPEPIALRRPHGHFERTGPYGEIEQGDTISCVHCRRHYESRVGLDRQLGWCGRCMGPTCGRTECQVCVPYEQRLDNCDAGLPELTQRADAVMVPREIAGVSTAGAVILEPQPKPTENIHV